MRKFINLIKLTAIRKQVDNITAPTTGLRPPGTETAPRAQRTVSDIPREKR